MAYIEFLRARGAMKIFAIVLAIVVGSIDYSIWAGMHYGHTTASTRVTVESGADGDAFDDHARTSIVHGKVAHVVTDERPFRSIPLGAIFGIASFVGFITATILGASLFRENGLGGFAFTKPVSRERLALSYIGVDVVSIVAMYAYGVILALASLALFGVTKYLVVEPNAAVVAVAGLSAAFMWYGVLQALTAMRTSGGGLIVGLSWPFFLLAVSLYKVDVFGPIFHAVVVAVDLFNPLAYFGFSSHNADFDTTSLLGFSQPACIAITSGIAVVALVTAVAGWKRLEV